MRKTKIRLPRVRNTLKIKIEDPEQFLKGVDMNGIKVLLFDIETAPNLGYVWGKWEQDVIENVQDWYIMSFAYKWLGEKTTHVVTLPDFKGYKTHPEDDKQLVERLWSLFNEADIIVAHNGADFDIRKANARFAIHGMRPPAPYKIIDTKLVAKRYFRLDSNKLDELGRQLGVGRKVAHTGFALWRGCMARDMKSWRLMAKYNKGDVDLLERVFLKLRPWIANYPIVRPENGTCRHCEGKHLTKSKRRAVKRGWKQQYQCQDCGAYMTDDKIIKE